MTSLLERRRPAAALAAAAALLMAISLLPGSASAQDTAVQQHPEGSDEGKGSTRDFNWNLDAEYSEQFGVQTVGHGEALDGFNGDVVAHGRYAYLPSWGNPAGNVEDDELTGEAPFCPSQGVRVYDLVNPSQPRLVSTFADASDGEGLEGAWTEKVIVQDVDTDDFTGTLAAVSAQICDIQEDTEALGGFALYDVTDPADPELLSTVDSEIDGPSDGSHEIWLEVRDGEAYVYTNEILQEFLTGDPEADEPGTPDLRIFDVSDPTDPEQVGEWGIWNEEGTMPLAEDDDGVPRTRFVHSAIVADETAYLSYWDRGTVILDVSDPADPQFEDSTGVPLEGLWSRGSFHSAWLDAGTLPPPLDVDSLLIENPEVFNPNPQEDSRQEYAFGYPRFTELGPAGPEVVGGFEMDSTRADIEDLPPGDWTTHDPKVRPGLPGDDDLVYFSWYSEGVPIVNIEDAIDASDIEQQDEETITGTVAGEDDALHAQFVPEPHADPYGFFQEEGVEFPFVWGVFLHSDFAERGDYALASDINSGLWVFRLDEEIPDSSAPADEADDPGFDDVTDANPHFGAIARAVFAEIARGTSEDPPLFSPGDDVTRGQMATFIAETLETAGYELPEGEDQFDDTDGHTHEDNIEALAAAGIIAGTAEGTFSPNLSVERGQVATFLLQALEWAVDDDIDPAGASPFDDTEGSAHEGNIVAAHEIGLVFGTSATTYEPREDTRRDQMASTVTRLLDVLELQ